MAASHTLNADQQDAHDKVQSLLATKPLDELKKIELANKVDINEKRLALRQLIGSRYKDIIDSATAIDGMKSSVSRLYDELTALQGYSSKKSHDLTSDHSSKSSTQTRNTQNNVSTSDLPPSQYEVVIVRRLSALSESYDAISRNIKSKRWIIATSVYLRSMKLLDQLSRLSTTVFNSSLRINDYLNDIKQNLVLAKEKLTYGLKRFLARTRLHHQVCQEDNQQNSRDVVALLQEWRLMLEKGGGSETEAANKSSFSTPKSKNATNSTTSREENVKLSVEIARIIETSALKPMTAGTAALLENGVQSTCGALACLALLENLSSLQLTQQYLRLRLEVARFSIDLTHYSAFENSSTPQLDILHMALCEWIRSTQWTFYLLNAMFLPTSERHSSNTDSRLSSPSPLPLVYLTMGTMVARQFGLQTPKSSETMLGEVVLNSLKSPLPAHQIQSMMNQWLAACVQLLPGASSSPISYHQTSILSTISSGIQLCQLESFLAYQIEHPLTKYDPNSDQHSRSIFAYPTSSPTWSGASTPNRSGSSTPHSHSLTSSSSLIGTPSSTLGGLSASALLAAAQIAKFKTISNRVCGRPVDLWSTFFHQIFLNQSQKIIQLSFASISISSQLDKALRPFNDAADLSSGIMEDDASTDESAVGGFIWSGGETWNSTTIEKQLDHAHGLTPLMRSLVSQFDDQLSLVLKDLRPLIIIEDDVASATNEEIEIISTASTTSPDPSNPEENAPVVRRRFRGSTKEDLIPLLRTAILENCEKLCGRLCATLQNQIDLLTSGSNLHPSRIQQCMVIGRLAKALDTHSVQLRKILWQLDWNTSDHTSFSSLSTSLKSSGPKWMDRMSRKPLGSLSTISSSPSPSSQYPQLASKSFQETYHMAFSKWVTRVTEELCAYFTELLTSPKPSHVPTRATWTNANVNNPDVKGELLVPAQPSPQFPIWLREIVSTVYRAGAHHVDRFVLEYLVYRVSKGIMDPCSKVIAQLTLKGLAQRDNAVQLWFDLRFVFDILSRRKLTSPFFIATLSESEQASSVSSNFESLISSLKSKFDPVEAGFYVPHISKNVKTSIANHATLFGMLMAEETSKSGGLVFASVDTTNSNTLSIVPNVPRFASLPVSTPTLATLREMRTSSSSKDSSLDLSGSSSDSARDSSSTSLSSSRLGSQGQILDEFVHAGSSAASQLITDKSKQAIYAAGSRFWGTMANLWGTNNEDVER